MFRKSAPFIFRERERLFKPSTRVDPALEPLQREFIEQFDTAWQVYNHENPEFRDNIAVRRLYLDPAMKRMQEIILGVARYFGVAYLSIGWHDLIAFGGIRTGGGTFKDPVAWTIAPIIGIDVGTGNGPQRQIYGLFDDFPELTGVFNTNTYVRLDDALDLGEYSYEDVEDPRWRTCPPDVKAIRKYQSVYFKRR